MSVWSQFSPLMMRIAMGKLIGFLIGLIGFFMMPYFLPEGGAMMQWAILLWYTTFGAIIGVFGVLDYHPVLKLPMPWFVRAPMIGAWLNFVLVLFIYDQVIIMMANMFGPGGVLQSPFWLAFEGAVVGLLIGYAATRVGGEGPETVFNKTESDQSGTASAT